jgi:NAD(P)-dependent dehydrogenase (short-subunit alcohol dehydrogenase family)
MGALDGKVAIITGAGANMGKAAAELFAAEGAQMVVADWDEESGAEVARQVGGMFVRADVGKSADVDALVAAAISRFGRLDIMYNNAGISRVATVLEATDEDFAALMNVDLGGVFYGTRAAAKVMRPAGAGIIINTASTNAIHGVLGMSLYSAAKAAVVQFTKVAAAELAPFGIRVNAICPGTIPSKLLAKQMGVTDEQIAALDDKQPIGRVGRPEEIAQGALYLATDQSSFVTGHALVIDGGMTAIGGFRL